MSINQLTNFANKFLSENFDGMQLEVPIKINGRLTRALGRFKHYKAPKKPIAIELAKDTIEYYELNEILDVLKHELVHYALYMQGKPYKDGDYYFENKLKELGISATQVYEHKGKVEVYACECDTYEYTRKLHKHNQYQGANYTCRQCKKHLRYVGQQVVK